jgi:hypothetical protein
MKRKKLINKLIKCKGRRTDGQLAIFGYSKTYPELKRLPIHFTMEFVIKKITSRRMFR